MATAWVASQNMSKWSHEISMHCTAKGARLRVPGQVRHDSAALSLSLLSQIFRVKFPVPLYKTGIQFMYTCIYIYTINTDNTNRMTWRTPTMTFLFALWGNWVDWVYELLLAFPIRLNLRWIRLQLAMAGCFLFRFGRSNSPIAQPCYI